MSSLPERQVISRRRARRAQAPTPVAGTPEIVRPPWGALLGLGVIVALVVVAGWALGRVIVPQPTGKFAGCRTATVISPHSFAAVPPLCIDRTKTYLAKVNTTAGEIDIAMPAADAPETVNNFVVLAVNGFYTGLTFHRVESWVVQGGDPQGDGRGGPGYSLPAESANKTWTADAVGMARNPDGSINGSQFFILKTDWPLVGPGATAFNHFGTVLGGTQILNTIKPGERILSVAISVQ